MHLETTISLELDSTELEDSTLELDSAELEDSALELETSAKQGVSTHQDLSVTSV